MKRYIVDLQVEVSGTDVADALDCVELQLNCTDLKTARIKRVESLIDEASGVWRA